MTLPTNIVFPIVPTDVSASDLTQINKYLTEQSFSLQRMYEQLAQGINGSIRTSFAVGNQNWTPTVQGTSTTGTFTYTQQDGWVLRQGLLVDLWADVKWTSAGTATGEIFLNLPYKVANSNNNPFTGIVQSGLLTYTAGEAIFINATPNTYIGRLMNTGTGIGMSAQQVTATGRLIIHLRYIGQADDR